MRADRPSNPAKNERELAELRVQWLAWALQLFVGFLAGCGVGYQLARLLFRSSLDEKLLIAGGAGLICGAFTSFYGNSAWMARSIFLAPEPAAPTRARAWSMVTGGAGGLLVLLTVAYHAITLFSRGDSSHFRGIDVFFFLIALLPALLAVYALRAGKGFWRFGIVDREETPLLFWIYVVLNGAAALGLVCAVLR